MSPGIENGPVPRGSGPFVVSGAALSVRRIAPEAGPESPVV
jgi:hypothetical protein